MKGDLKIEINEQGLSKLLAIAGEEEIYPSIHIRKRYLGMQRGRTGDCAPADHFFSHNA